jgi:hypothetical protein
MVGWNCLVRFVPFFIDYKRTKRLLSNQKRPIKSDERLNILKRGYMQIEIDAVKMATGIATSITLALLVYIGSTVYQLDKHSELLEYKIMILENKIDSYSSVAQDLYETKADKFRPINPKIR